MIYECTDCHHCAVFAYGYRIFCMAPDMPADEVLKYQFLGDQDAERCPSFEERDFPEEYTQDQLGEALAMPDDDGQDNSYGGVRKWLDARNTKEKK